MQFTLSCDNPDAPEISRRLVAVQAEMARQGLDFYLSHDPSNVYYLTNFKNYVHERPFILVVPASGAPTLLCPKLEETHVRSRAVGELQLLTYFEFPAPKGQMWFDRLHELLEPSHRVGVESLCPLAVFRAVPGTAVETDIVDTVREIKSAYEIGRLAYAGQWLSRGHARLLAAARPGASTLGLNSQIADALVGELLADNPQANLLACEAIAIATPPAFSHDPHLVPDLSCQLTEGGPHVTLLCGTANGYGAEVERTFFIGRVPEAAVRPFHAMLEARALGFECKTDDDCLRQAHRGSKRPKAADFGIMHLQCDVGRLGDRANTAIADRKDLRAVARGDLGQLDRLRRVRMKADGD